MKFEKDFDFESANAQFNKEEIDREFHNKLKLKGEFSFSTHYFYLFELPVFSTSLDFCGVYLFFIRR